MHNKTVTYSLFGIILLTFTIYFSVQNAFNNSGQSITDELNNIMQYAQQDNWTEAEKSADRLRRSWDKAKYFLALNYAEEDYSLFLDNLARMQGAIKAKDNTETICQAQSTLRLWTNFKKIIPLP